MVVSTGINIPRFFDDFTQRDWLIWYLMEQSGIKWSTTTLFFNFLYQSLSVFLQNGCWFNKYWISNIYPWTKWPLSVNKALGRLVWNIGEVDHQTHNILCTIQSIYAATLHSYSVGFIDFIKHSLRRAENTHWRRTKIKLLSKWRARLNPKLSNGNLNTYLYSLWRILYFVGTKFKIGFADWSPYFRKSRFKF